ncbi:MAG: DUF1177 domain-containing protein [Armatimonadota bacterium]|nr:DUF1177 domain-containing protein [Armatimonadota bacterium]MDR7495128.1 DUF1177 domain-containing protein [Armatimonadota bacterium]MDR7546204.1 DUF1177 domain-containing protein [Armatimonadota bacterium]MDR7559314.1 DUF1177 domain-containing protein [Armatimonadota bacterium]MDR7573891.1 DUF1177 domain-containing protein [Armatimonadota bacterium]
MWKQTIEAYELLDAATVNGEAVAATLRARGLEVQVRHVEGERGATDVLRISVPGTRGRTTGGDAPTLGVIGQLGGIGARPARIGLVSDADGAITAVAVALKLADMRRAGDLLPGDVIVTTHICPQAPTRPHHPVPFMDSPVGIDRLVRLAVDPAMEAILSIDTTRGNRVVNSRGIAISPTVKEGYLLRVSEDLLDLLQAVTGRLPVVLPLTTQDITPYGNDIFHLNSIAQPATVTTAPVVGVALTTEVAVPGPATGASQAADIEEAARFCIEVAKAYGAGSCRFYDPEEFHRLLALYGPMSRLQAPHPWPGEAGPPP